MLGQFLSIDQQVKAFLRGLDVKMEDPAQWLPWLRRIGAEQRLKAWLQRHAPTLHSSHQFSGWLSWAQHFATDPGIRHRIEVGLDAATMHAQAATILNMLAAGKPQASDQALCEKAAVQ